MSTYRVTASTESGDQGGFTGSVQLPVFEVGASSEAEAIKKATEIIGEARLHAPSLDVQEWD